MPPKTPLETRQILDMNAFDAGRAAATSHDGLLARRLRNFGAASVLFYEEPIEMVSASGAWMTAATGDRYLDFYNNVPSVGHCHPRVTGAVADQIQRLNINTRYLNSVTERYLERLKASLPAEISNIAMACSGSEANDLAMRAAMAASGARGFIVTEAAYHGNTHLVIQASPSAYKRGGPPDFVRCVPAPSHAAYGDDVAEGFAAAVAGAAADLADSGHGCAALICDSIFSSDGVFADPPGFLAPAIAAARAAGGLYIADEVQPGFGRTGADLWGFRRHGVTPDIVTMGKPMGNGFPMSAMATRPEVLAGFCQDFGYFNTFGGNPVAAAAGLAVLDAITQDGLIENAAAVGAALKERLIALQQTEPRIAAVRGAGLFIGVDLCGDVGAPDPALATRVINGLKDRHVLIGAAGKYGHTLKIRPPLCLTPAEAMMFAAKLEDTLHAID